MKYKTPDIIQRIFYYLRNQLSNKERHALEKEINTDPFLQDAMDGFAQLSANELESDLYNLQQRLTKRVNEKKTRKLTSFIRIAASILLVIGLGTTAFFIAHRNLTRDKLAIESSKANEPVKATQETLKPLSQKITEPQLIKKEEQTLAPNKPMAMATKKRVKNAPLTANNEDLESEFEFSDELAMANTSADSIITNQPLQKESNQPAMAKAKVKLNGRIIDWNGDPIAGATIVEKGTDNGTVTDLDGYFILKTDTNSTLNIASIGYLEKEIKSAELNKNKQPLTLTEDLVALDEVVVVGYGTQKKSDITGSVATVESPELIKQEESTSATPQPEGGYKKFNKYIDKNKRLDANKTIQVKLRITIATTGEISAIEAIESPEKKYSDEAIRLLKNGPVWEPAVINHQPVDSTIELTITL